MVRLLLVFTALVLAPATLARAAAPQPEKPVAIAAYTGRWYEVARIHNLLQLDCEGPTMDFTGSGATFTVTNTCHKGSPTGAAVVHKGAGRITDPGVNAKIRVGFLGGFVQKDYWIVDHAPDYRWALLVTPDGKFFWLLSRTPTLAERPQVIAHAKALGFDLTRLEFAKQPPA